MHRFARPVLPRFIAAPSAVALLAGGAAALSPLAAADPSPTPVTTDYTGPELSYFGSTLAHGTCDLNADGYPDVLAGAYGEDAGHKDNGAVHIIWGGKDLKGGPIADADATHSTSIVGSNEYALLGSPVNCAGDVNGDGIDDVVLGEYQNQKAYVVFGSKNFGPVDLANLGDRGFAMTAASKDGYRTGFAVRGLGDLNGDGKAEVGILSLTYDHSSDRKDTGRVWVVAGRSKTDTVDLEATGSSDVLKTIDNAANSSYLQVVSPAGDVDGDGVPDIAVSASAANVWGGKSYSSGVAYVVSGAGGGNVDLGDKSQYLMRIVGGSRAYDNLGRQIESVGDLNNDGLGDIAVSAPGSSTGMFGKRKGGVAIVYGTKDHASVVTDPLATSGPAVFSCGDDIACSQTDAPRTKRGIWVNGTTDDENFGWDMAVVPDLKGGRPNLLVGATSYSDATATNRGAAYLVPIPADTVDVLDTSDLEAAHAVRYVGQEVKGQRFGRAVASPGDVNGDGVADFVIGGDNGLADRTGLVRIYRNQPGTATITSAFTGVTQGQDGNATVTYDVTVTGDPNTQVTYDLLAQPGLPSGAQVVGWSVSGDATASGTDTSKPLLARRTLWAGGSQKFTVTYSVRGLGAVAASERTCQDNTAGHGLQSSFGVHTASQDAVAAACGDVPTPKPVVNLTIHTAGTKKIGATTYAWGTLTGTTNPTKVCTQTLTKPGTWSTSQCTTTKKDGTYTIPLTYHHNTPGTTTWRTIAPATNTTSTTATLTRTR